MIGSHLPDSNRGPSLYKSVALPAELRWQIQHHTNRFFEFSKFEIEIFLEYDLFAFQADVAQLVEQLHGKE